MNLLLEGIDAVETRGDPATAEVSSIELDSRSVAPGALFCCLPGRTADGHDHAPEALSRGATALLVERPLELPVVQAVVGPGRARPAMAALSRALYGDPARSLLTVGVTGTNGKTTLTHLLGAVLDAHGTPNIVIGTLDGARTTPESPYLQRQLADALAAGRRAALLEVSSHALTESRVDGIVFDAAVFTNLSHDHLDHHGTMERYFAAKASMFVPERAALGVVNADDPYGARLLEQSTVPVIGYRAADALDVVGDGGGTAFTWRGHRVRLALAGAHNVVNALGAATTAAALGVSEDAIVAGLAALEAVPGRFEVLRSPAPFTVVVDYAHTPEALAVALGSARRLAGVRRVLCVFGCGGDRDRAKRPEMGAAAAGSADVVVVTSDNPRSEDPAAIIEQVVAGIPAGTDVFVEADRSAAIESAVGMAGPGDVVVVAGKGHETAIETAGERVAFDDRRVAGEALARRGWPATGGGSAAS